MFSDPTKPAVVYKATIVATGEFYIGVTGQRLSCRIGQHLYRAKRGDPKMSAFSLAIRAHGAQGIDWEVVAEFENGADAVAEEKRLIAELGPHLSATFGGEGYRPRVVSEEQKAALAALHRGNTYALGMKHSEATKEKLREIGLRNKEKWLKRSMLGPISSSKRVVCINDGTSYASASEAAARYGLQKSIVIEVCNRNERRKTAGGMVFRYEGDVEIPRTVANNMKNAPRVTNSSGLKGISPYKSEGRDTGRWRAQISFIHDGKRRKIHLGLFDTKEEAHAAYLRAQDQYRDGNAAVSSQIR